MKEDILHLINSVINIVMGIVTVFLLLRFALRLLSANPGTPFVSWVYSVSNTLVSPFRGIFANAAFDTGVIDITALVALIAYLILGYIAALIVNNLVSSGSHHHRIGHV